MKHLTVRNLPPDLAEALEREKRQRNKSLNLTVIDLLRQSLGIGTAKRRNNLARLAGTWNEEEFRRFQQAISQTEQIDEELWT